MLKTKVKLWLADTGCGHDLVGKDAIYAMKKVLKQSLRPMTFHTANGDCDTETQCELWCDELGGEMGPCVLPSTPPVMSIGFRCLGQGYTFVWPPKENPYFITPDGLVVECEVYQYIPYLRPGAPRTRPRARKGARCFACSPPRVSSGESTGKRVSRAPTRCSGNRQRIRL